MATPWPPIFLLATHLEADELHALEDRVPNLTYDIHEAEIVVGKISKRERAQFELRRARLETEPVVEPRWKRARLDEDADGQGDEAIVHVLKLSWLQDSLAKGEMLPVQDYLLYQGRKLLRGERHVQPSGRASSSSSPEAGRGRRSGVHGIGRDSERGAPPALQPQTTSESEEALPPLPPFLHTTYSCQRPTPVNAPNAAFVNELKKVRDLRLLQGDQIGVRAYSTAIATLAAYPHGLLGPHDVARLPGCGTKMAVVYRQWADNGVTDEIAKAAEDPRLTTLRLFYNIWGVGDRTAVEFYRKGWRDLDDLVEHAWGSLSRVQQIGIKYYDEFLLPIPRDEVEAIAATVVAHARRLDDGFQMVIVGSYRRGKAQSGDVDVVLSHRDEAHTLNVIEPLVASLEESRFVTHTLSLSRRNSERGQWPAAWQGSGSRRGSATSGFDTLDKALVVWQDPRGPGEEGKQGAPAHRRVDIIVSPWKTAGCAVLGWSGGTTFQRDLRRYSRHEKNWRFDSSGIRSRADGAWVDVEGEGGGWAGPAPDMETAERRVFAGLGLEYRRPEERCTG